MKLKLFAMTLLAGLFGAGAVYAASPEITLSPDGLVTTTYTWDFASLGATMGGSASSNGLSTETSTVFGESTTVLKAVNFYETGTSVLYNWVTSANTVGSGAKLEFNMDLNLASANGWQTILHVGAQNQGLTLGVGPNGQLTFASNNDYALDASTLTLTSNTWTHVCFTLENGVASITAGGNTVKVNSLSDIVWSNTEEQNTKYSIGVNAPGWTAYPLNTLQVANMSVSFTVPEPATATLSLLALAGLAVRRRRRTV